MSDVRALVIVAISLRDILPVQAKSTEWPRATEMNVIRKDRDALGRR